jgi:hypothetical protein
MFDPNRMYSVTDTINFLRQVDLDLETQAHAANVCSAIIGDFKRLHQGKTTVTFNECVGLVRAGDKVHHQGAILYRHHTR